MFALFLLFAFSATTYSTLCHQDKLEIRTCPAQDRDHLGFQAKNHRHPLTA